MQRVLLRPSLSALNNENFRKETVHLVILSGTPYEKLFIDFARRMNSASASKICVSIVRSTGPTLGQLLFNNANASQSDVQCCLKNCIVCKNGLEDKSGVVFSTTTKRDYKLGGRELNCNDGGFMLLLLIAMHSTQGKLLTLGNVWKNIYKLVNSPLFINTKMTVINATHIMISRWPL